MAEIIYEQREFTDRNTGITTQYDYIAIKGGSETKQYEVQLKNLVQSEKMALSMINDLETPQGLEVTTRNATDEEKEAFKNNAVSADESDFFDD